MIVCYRSKRGAEKALIVININNPSFSDILYLVHFCKAYVQRQLLIREVTEKGGR